MVIAAERSRIGQGVRNWIVGARLKTLPATLVPVAVGSAIVYSLGQVVAWRTVLTLLFALSVVIGANFLNDYSDGMKGTDDHRVGPLRLVGADRASARVVLRHGLVLYGVGAATGIVLAVTVSWWLLALTGLCCLAGWLYTGGSKPYGYRALGEVSVFLFHGVIAVCATVFIQLGRIPLIALVASVPVGLLVCALLVTNNLRDIPTDAAAGKRTLAVVIGDRWTRVLYLIFVLVSFGVALAMATVRPWTLLVLAALPAAVFPVYRVLGGARGARLVAALEHTCLLLLVFGALLTVGLVL